jgi:hypothetical protein
MHKEKLRACRRSTHLHLNAVIKGSSATARAAAARTAPLFVRLRTYVSVGEKKQLACVIR